MARLLTDIAARFWWPRGGVWAIQESTREMEHILEFVEGGVEVGEDREAILLCVDQSGTMIPALIQHESDPVHKPPELKEPSTLDDLLQARLESLDPSHSRPLRYQEEIERSTDNTGYYPLEVTPDLYLAFSSIGAATWDWTEGEYLSRHQIPRFQDRPLSEDLQKRIVDFHEQYGPPYNLLEEFAPDISMGISTYTTSVHPMLRQAQLINLFVGYLGFKSGTTRERILRQHIEAILESEYQEHNRILAFKDSRSEKLLRQNWKKVMDAIAYSESPESARKHLIMFLEGSGYSFQIVRSIVSQATEEELRRFRAQIASLPADAKYEKPYLIDAIEKYKDSNLLKALESVILAEVEGRYGMGDLTTSVSLSPDGPAFSLQYKSMFKHLVNVIWYQAVQVAVKGAEIKRCPSRGCLKIDRLFEASRPNQIYCTTGCRNYHNVNLHRGKI